MGIFDFLKQFSDEKKVKEIKLDKLDSVIDSRLKKIFEDKGPEISGIKIRILKEKERLEENIQKLNKAELKNPNIPERAKQIGEGNRYIYIKKLNLLANKIDLPERSDEILAFCNSFDKDLDYFSESTARSYHILQEFFVEESGAIVINIRDLNILIKKLKKITEDSEIKNLNELKKKADEFQQKEKQKQIVEEKIRLEEEEIKKKNKKINEKEQKLTDIENGSGYKKFMELIDKKKLQEQEIEFIKKQCSFSAIESSLKKYERLILDDKLVRKYLDNPLNALLEDKELKIVEVISKMKDSIINQELKLKEEKREKILKELDKFNRNYFEAFLSKYNELNKRLSKLESEIEKIRIIEEVARLKETIKQDKIEIERDELKTQKMLKELDRNDIENLKKDLEDNLKNCFGVESKIIFDEKQK
ncbi:MAG: hypothetical protein KKD48_02575 [Nanoarchaeota archaeon]|nr:hypothetical protein [Nanoarchaeota archaeon]